jgi:drug/metabolite transporter (DMT)-like permease
MTAVILALASAAFLGAGLVLTQFGLRDIHPLSGAAISIPTFTLVFLALSPFLLHGTTIVWHAVPIFAAVGLFFPGVLTLLTFASNRALGPVVTGALGNLSPLLAVTFAVVLLHEPLRATQFAGLVVVVAGVLLITFRSSKTMTDWRTWALLLPLGASALRGITPPIIRIGLQIWPDPIAAGLTGYIFSTLTVLLVERWRNGGFVAQGPVRGRLWFACTGLCNGIGTLLLYAALGAGPVSLVAPLAATYPLMTVGLSALVLGHVTITARILAGTALTVAGVVLILIG